MTDIAPELLENLQKSFDDSLAADKKAAALLGKIEAGNGNYVIAGDYAERVGESLAESFRKNLSSEVLPDGKMYYNIAERTVKPLLEEEYGIVSKAAATVQKSLNTKAGIGLNAVRPAYDSDAVKGIINKVCSYDQYDDAAWVLNDAAVSFSRSVVDRTLKANIEFQGKSGRSPKIVRRAGYNCCQWCADLDGIYEYPGVPENVYRRHDNCRCDVEYDPGTGRAQNVHTKEWRDADERDRIEERKSIGLNEKRTDKTGLAGNIINNYKILNTYTPEDLKNELEKAGYDVTPLSKGNYNTKTLNFTEYVNSEFIKKVLCLLLDRRNSVSIVATGINLIDVFGQLDGILRRIFFGQLFLPQSVQQSIKV